MDGLLTMDKQQYVSQMQAEFRRIMEQVADAVNAAPTGNVISGSEKQVRDLMAELRKKAFELAVQMRIDSTEPNFSPSERRDGQTESEQRTGPAQRGQCERTDSTVAAAVRGQRTRKRASGRPAGG
jgi:hypothetical protein